MNQVLSHVRAPSLPPNPQAVLYEDPNKLLHPLHKISVNTVEITNTMH
jgi:hypothetical protein